MWSFDLGNGWGGSKPNNVHPFEITENAAEFGEYFQIIFTARHWSDKLSWKIEDSSGCQHDLPYLFKAGELKKFNIIVDGCAGISDYYFECSLHIWPKEFPIPIAKITSLGTVRIMPPEARTFNTSIKYKQHTPSIRIKRKGEADWTNYTIFLLKFNRCDEIIEVQYHSPLPNGDIIHSPTLEVDSMWQEFDFETACQINLEEMNLHRRFSPIINKDKFYKSKCKLWMKNITLGDEETSIGWIDSERIKTDNYSLVPGARYEFRVEETSLNVSFRRILDVPMDHPIDNALWTTLFGSADRVIFSRKDAQKHNTVSGYMAAVGTPMEINIDLKNLVLYKNGFFSYKSTFKQFRDALAREISDYGGTFSLSRLDSKNVQINLSKLFKSKTSAKPNVELSRPTDLVEYGESPATFLFPELLNAITSYDTENRRLMCRLVCKSWCLSLDPVAIFGTFKADCLQLFNTVFDRSKEPLE